MQQTPKWQQVFIKWLPTGAGIWVTASSLFSQEWMQAAISSVASASWLVVTSLVEGYLEGLKEGLKEGGKNRGKKSAESLLKQADTLPDKVRWMTSGFQDKYYRSLKDKCLKLKTEGFNIGLSALNLEDVFVPLKVASSVPRNVAGGIISRLEESQKSGEIWHFLANNPGKTGKIGNDRCIVILAPPGSGKTTLLQHITLTYAQKSHHKDKNKRKAPNFIPVLLRLRDVREQLIKQKPPSLNELIREEVKRLPSCKQLNPPPNWFEERLRNGKCLVMLDGLDEVTKKAERSQVSRWVSEQMRNYSQATFILTSRPHGYQREILGEQVDRVLAVQPFTLSQMKRFIHKWYEQTEVNQQRRNTPAVRQEAEEKAKDLIEALLQNPAIRKMASNPLLVTMIATVHYLGNALPGRRVELYKEICDVLLGRRIYAKKLNLPLIAEQNQLLLQKLALDLMERGTQKFDSPAAKLLIQEDLEKASTNQMTVEEWLEMIKNNVGLIVEKEIGSYEFAHLSFQEYLAAVELKKLIQADKDRENILIQNIPNSNWAETIRLYAAQSEDNTKIIQVALQNSTVASLSLAYDCLQEGGKQKVDRETQRQLEQRLVSGLESSEPEITKMAAQVSLSRRLNRLLVIDDNISIDRSYINCAEYQLFVDEQLNSQFRFQSGSAVRPITGISYENAIGFCTWLNGSGSCFISNNGNAENIYYYRLPTVQETQEIAATQASQQLECWTIGESNNGNSERKGIRVIRAKISTTYTRLANYLVAGEWQQADEETAQIMLKIANRESAGNFDVESIKNIPCEELQTIDRLWLHYSKGGFGLGIQATVWETVGGNPINPNLWCLNYAANTEDIFLNFVRRLKACGIKSPLPLCKSDVVTVNSQGQEIQREQNQATYFTENLGNGVALDLVSIPGGTFMMGTEDEEIERLVQKFNWEGFRREKPQHQVAVQTFFMGKYPVTQAQWKAVAALPKVNQDLEAEPAYFQGNNRLVERVSWYDAVEFCLRLSQYTGRQYRLPSEAEWEYACRAGTVTPFHFGETIAGDLANYRASETFAEESKGEYREQTTPVGQFPPNAFGLYDMHGNVWEWCLDDWHDNYENAPTDGSVWFDGDDDNLYQKTGNAVLRGGSWLINPRYCRSAYRGNLNGVERDSFDNFIGFRVVCAFGRILQ